MPLSVEIIASADAVTSSNQNSEITTPEETLQEKTEPSPQKEQTAQVEKASDLTKPEAIPAEPTNQPEPTPPTPVKVTKTFEPIKDATTTKKTVVSSNNNEATAVSSATQNSKTNTAAIQANTRDILRLELEERIERKYPRIARKRGWEGEVLLGFRIARNGSIEKIRIARSSGYPLLDRSAVSSLAKVKQVAMTSISLAEEIEMDLAISYRLQDI